MVKWWNTWHPTKYIGTYMHTCIHFFHRETCRVVYSAYLTYTTCLCSREPTTTISTARNSDISIVNTNRKDEACINRYEYVGQDIWTTECWIAIDLQWYRQGLRAARSLLWLVSLRSCVYHSAETLIWQQFIMATDTLVSTTYLAKDNSMSLNARHWFVWSFSLATPIGNGHTSTADASHV